MLCGLSLVTSPAGAFCVDSTDPRVVRLEQLADQNPHAALRAVQSEINTSLRANAADHEYLAWLYTLQATAYTKLVLTDDALQSVNKGLALVPSTLYPTHVELLALADADLSGHQDIERAFAAATAAREVQKPGTVTYLCLTITLGVLRDVEDRPDSSLTLLTEAYRASSRPGLEKQHAYAAYKLSDVMSEAGDFTQAHALVQEQLHWARTHGDTFDVSDALYKRAHVFRRQHAYTAALADFSSARALSVELADDQGVAFADFGTCDVLVSMQKVSAARPACESALRLLTPDHTNARKNVQRFLARMDLDEGHPARALETLNELLDHGGTDMFAGQATSAYRLRARAHAELKQYPAAYADMDEYARRSAADDATQRDRNTSVQRALFETDRQVARSLELRRELDFSREREQQEAQRNLVLLSGGGVSLALLLYIAIASLRHRTQLERLAHHDGLTGLPNRRFVAEFAAAALVKARENATPLAIALLDLDHFKAVNDLYGHAVGDSVLRTFGQTLRERMPATGAAGRWGGEEFLLVFTNTTLATAVDIIERLRVAALEVRLPEAPELRVHFSAGLASGGTRKLMIDEIIAKADAALYEAKKEGRDLTCIETESYVAPSAHVRHTSRSTDTR